jgi:molybdopterin-dependent oxidoreductase alpha subunit
MEDQNHEVNPENPEQFQQLRLDQPQDHAAGMPAVFSSVKHILDEMDVARGAKALFSVNQTDGYDCPGCAWPDPDNERSKLGEYCENGAKAIAEEATIRKLDAEFFKNNSIADLSRLNDYQIGKMGRIAQPMFLPKGELHYQPISWSEAFKRIAWHLNQLASPDEAIFYTSGRTSNEAAFLYQLFVREFGTNNLPDCSNMCHESSGVALSETLGIGKGSVTLDDFYHAEVIIILGQNPGTNHPRMLSALQKAKENGCCIISINPLPEAGLMAFNNPQTIKGALGIKTKLTDHFVQIKINGDMAFLKAIELILLKEEQALPGTVFDQDFIRNYTEGYEAFLKNMANDDPEQLALECGIDIAQIKEIAQVLKHKKRIIACWAMGLTQHKNAVASIQEIVNLLLLKGSIGIKGGGTCPVRGHSNVQGDRTMGIYEKPSIAFLNRIEKVFGFKPPEHHGLDTVDSIHAMMQNKAKVFIATGGNFLSATPDTQYTAAALKKCKLTVQISTKLNRSHLITGEEALILPCLGRSDKDVINGELQFVTTENSMGVVQQSKGSLTPVSNNLLSEPAIVCYMAKATLASKSKVRWDDYLQHYDHIRNDIEKTIEGFEQYNERVRKIGGFYLPNSSRNKKFNTHSGKAHFTITQTNHHPLAADELLMMTIRSHDQFNTTIYGLNDRYRGIHNERRVIFMHKDDIAKRGLIAGDIVDLFSNFHNRLRTAHRFIVVEYPIAKGCAATYFPETNVLVPIESVADKSNTPTSKAIAITLKKHTI